MKPTRETRNQLAHMWRWTLWLLVVAAVFFLAAALISGVRGRWFWCGLFAVAGVAELGLAWYWRQAA